MRTRGYNSCTSWVAAFACSVVGFLVPIPIRIAGLFYIIIIDRYQTTRMYATAPIMVFGILRSITGPLVGYLGQVWGLRAVTLAGCLLASTGIAAVFFAEDIVAVIIFLGFIYGIGFGLGNTLGPEILKQHFNKDINLVNGMFITGCCMGALIMPPVVQALIDEYGDSGMFLLVGGIMLQSVPFAMLLKDPKNKEYHASLENRMKRVQITDKLSKIHPEEKMAFISKNDDAQESTAESEDYKYRKDESIQSELIGKPTEKQEKLMQSVQIIKKSASNDADLNNFSTNNIHTSRSCSELNYKYISCNQSEELAKHDRKYSLPDSNSENNSNLDQNNTDVDIKNCQIKTFPEDPEISVTTTDRKRHQLVRLFLDPTFLVTMTVQSFHAFIMTLNWTIMIDYARDKGISVSDSLYFLMFLPLAEITGSLTLNWISDRGFLTRTKYCAVCYVILTCVAISLVWVNSFDLMMTGILTYGVFTGSVGAVFPGMVHEFIEEDLQGLALASRFVLYAFLCLSKSPLTGYFRGTLGSYDWIYFIIAICCAFSGVLVIFTPRLAARRIKNKVEKVTASKF